jgi:thioredoxin-related protein
VKRLMGWLTCVVIGFACSTVATRSEAQGPAYVVASYPSESASSIVWHDDLDSGWRESKRTGRPMVIFITSAHCRYCDAMKAATWRDIGIKSRVGTEFIAVRLCPERNAKELSRIQVDVYPTTLVALPQGKVVDHRKGYQPPELLHALLNRVTRR